MNDRDAKKRQQEEEEEKKRLEEKRKREKQSMISGLRDYSARAKDPYRQLRSIYGRQGKFPADVPLKKRYDKLVIPKSKTLDDNMIAAIYLGAAMNPYYLNRVMTGSSFTAGSSNYIDFNRVFLLENMKPTEMYRMGYFPETMIQAKLDTTKALQEYDNGHPEMVYAYIQRFVSYAAKCVKNDKQYTSALNLSDSVFLNTKSVERLAAELMNKEPFKDHIRLPEYDRMKLNAVYNQSKARDHVYNLKYQMMTKPPAAGSKERADLVADLMFYEYVSGILEEGTRTQGRMQDALTTELLEKYGVDMSSPEYLEMLANAENGSLVYGKVITNIMNNSPSTEEVIMSRPNGIQKLREYYMDSIRKTETFQNLLNAKGRDLEDQLMHLTDTTSQGFSSLKKLPRDPELDRYKELCKPDYDAFNQEIDTAIADISIGYARKHNKLRAYDKKNLQRNVSRIDEYIGDFDYAVKKDTDDASLQHIRTGMDDLRKQADSMAKAETASAEDLKTYTNSIDGLTENIKNYLDEHKNDKSEERKPIICMLRKLSRNLTWNKEGILEPQRNADREKTLQKYGKTYEDPSPEGINALIRQKKELLEVEKNGLPPAGKELIDRSIRATEKLGEMLQKKSTFEGKDKEKATGYLKDIMADRIYRWTRIKNGPMHEMERYAAEIAGNLPEFQKLIGSMNANSVGRMAFEDEAGQILKKYKDEELSEFYAKATERESKAVSTQLPQLSKKEEAEIKNQKPVIHKINETNIIHDDESEIIPKNTNDNELAGIMNKKKPVVKKPKKQSILFEYDEASDDNESQENIILTGKSKVKKESNSIINVKKDAPPVNTTKKKTDMTHDFDDDILDNIINANKKFEQKKGTDHIITTNTKKEKETDHIITTNTKPDQEKETDDIITTSMKPDKEADDIITKPDQEKAAAEAFLKTMDNLQITRSRVIATIQQMRAPYNDRFDLTDSEEDILQSMNSCLRTLNSSKTTPLQMYSSLNEMSSMIKLNKGRDYEKAKVLQYIFYEAVKPLNNTEEMYDSMRSTLGVDLSWRELSRRVVDAAQAYNLRHAPQNERNAVSGMTEAKANARYRMYKALEKACGKSIMNDLTKWDPDGALMENDQPKSLHELAKNCVAKYFLDTAEAPDADLNVLNGLTIAIVNNGFKGQVSELEKNPVFKSIAEKYPEDYYSQWKKIMDQADAKKIAAASTLEKMKEKADLQGLSGYVAYGEHGDQDMLLIPNNNNPKAKNAQNSRLADVLGNQLLANPMFSMLRQAVAAKKISFSDVKVEAMAYIERKHLRVFNENGTINREFRQKLESGEYCKELAKSQTRFLNQSKTRGVSEKTRLKEKMQVPKNRIL